MVQAGVGNPEDRFPRIAAPFIGAHGCDSLSIVYRNNYKLAAVLISSIELSAFAITRTSTAGKYYTLGC